jgi:hypothetical protein
VVVEWSWPALLSPPVFSADTLELLLAALPAMPGSWLSLESSFCRSRPSRADRGGGDGV